MAKYADLARERIRTKLKSFANIVQQAKTRNLNEADTRDIVKAMLGDLLGVDPFFEVTGEFSVKGQYADFAVKFADRIQYFVEVKSIDTKLDEKHLFQVIGYAANHGVEWAVLTNADEWRVFRLFAGDERRTELLFSVSMSGDTLADLIEKFFNFSKEGFRQRALESYWVNHQALAPLKVAELLVGDAMVTALRKEIARQGKVRVDDETVKELLLHQILRGDIVDSLADGAAKSKSATKRKNSR